jgi:hypothetical protein
MARIGAIIVPAACGPSQGAPGLATLQEGNPQSTIQGKETAKAAISNMTLCRPRDHLFRKEKVKKAGDNAKNSSMILGKINSKNNSKIILSSFRP